MADGRATKHIIIDLKTGFAYGIKLDAEGNCKGVQYLNTVIEKQDGSEVATFSPFLSETGDPVPYGQTTCAVELTQDGEPGEIFTLVWPEKEAAGTGALPVIAKRALPDDLVKAGIAPAPKSMKGQKGSGVDNEEDLKEALKNINAMIGLDNAKNDIQKNIALAQLNQLKVELGLVTKPISRHMVFTGNPGTGKTTFAREVAKVYYALGFIDRPDVKEVLAKDLVGEAIGQTGPKTAKVIESAKGGVLFIDEFYSLWTGDPSNGDVFNKDAIATLVAAMENMRDDLVVIVAGYTEPMKRAIESNEGLKSRFSTFIEFDDYGIPELGRILDGMMKERGYTMDTAARAYALTLLENEKNRAGPKKFANARAVRTMVQEAEKAQAQRMSIEGILTKNRAGLSIDDLKKKLATITLEDMLGVPLESLNKKEDVKGIGYGDSVTKVPANDTKNEAPPGTLSAKATRHFKT